MMQQTSTNIKADGLPNELEKNVESESSSKSQEASNTDNQRQETRLMNNEGQSDLIQNNKSTDISGPVLGADAITKSTIQQNAIQALSKYYKLYDELVNIVQQPPSQEISVPPIPFVEKCIQIQSKGDGYMLTPVETTPHLRRIQIVNVSSADPLRDQVQTILPDTTYSFVPQVERNFDGNYDVLYPIIDTDHPHLRIYIDPMNLGAIEFTVRGQPLIDIQRLTGQQSTRDPGLMFGPNGYLVIAKIIFGIVAAASHIGTYTLTRKNNSGKKQLLDRAAIPSNFGFPGITGELFPDDFEKYGGSMPEVIGKYNKVEWIAREFESLTENLRLGVISSDNDSVEGHRYKRTAYINIDSALATCHGFLIDEICKYRLDTNEYIALHQSVTVDLTFFKGYRHDLRSYKWTAQVINTDNYLRSYLTFPSGGIFFDGYRHAFFSSLQFRQSIYDTLVSQAESILDHSQIITDADFRVMLNTAPDMSENLNTTYGELGTQMLTFIKMLSPRRLASALVGEFFPQYYDCIPRDDMNYGVTTNPNNFGINLLYLKVSFLLNPILYSWQKHLKALYIYKFLLFYFKDETTRWIFLDGWGRNDDDQVIPIPPNLDSPRSESVVSKFTILTGIPSGSGSSDPGKHQLFVEVLKFLRDERYCKPVNYNLPSCRYRFYGGTRTIPGEPSIPGDQLSSMMLGAYLELKDVIPLYKRYFKKRSNAGDTRTPARIQGALPDIEQAFDNLIASTAEFLHQVYFFAGYTLSLSPLIFQENPHLSNDSPIWREFYALVEDQVEVKKRNSAVMTSPYKYPKTVTFLKNFANQPVSPSEAGHIVTAWSSPFCNYQNVKSFARDLPLDFQDSIPSYLIGIHPSDHVSAWRSALVIGQRYSEIIRITSEVSLGKFIELPALRTIIDECVRGGKFNTTAFREFASYLGSMVDEGEAAKQSLSEIEKIPSDPRCYYPAICKIRNDREIVVGSVQRIFYTIRNSVKERFNLLCDVVFNPMHGVLKISHGIELYKGGFKNLTFKTQHNPSNVMVTIDSVNVMNKNQETERYFNQFVARWYRFDGGQYVSEDDAYVVFVSAENLLEMLSLKVGQELKYVNVLIERSMRYSSPVLELLYYGVSERLFLLYMPDAAIVQNYLIMDPISAKRYTSKEKDDVVDLVKNYNRFGCYLLRSYDTAIPSHVLEPPTIDKYILPINPRELEIFASHGNTFTSRNNGQIPKIDTYFPAVRINESNEMPIVTDPTTLRTELLYYKYPFAMRTLCFIWHEYPANAETLAFSMKAM